MKTYKLYIREYSIVKNGYIVREEIVKTNDIYHEIGKIYCKSIVEIKRIDYEDITDNETIYEERINKIDRYIKDRIGEYCNADDTRENINKNHYIKVLKDLYNIVNGGDAIES